MSILVTCRKVLLRLLKQGYNPYTDNTELHRKLTSKNNAVNNPILVKKEIKDLSIADDKLNMTIQEAFDFGIKLK
ncbi:hypothetical protein [Maribacter sp. ACAM166]|uniref:hypothetical protein n=1 Tax=Maribacter sp. ACAM166 TaxID=2508996 RepID=UPI0010FEEBBD|nr:hypothetical protein [Maribacter sp. ACAM166]TLP74142.1 hypothetical protein ES765_16525 [Maribacter sp. ACAM166]